MPAETVELSPVELALAQARLGEMAERFVADGTLRTPQWRAVFARTWRHPYVPCYYPELHQPLVSGADPRQREQWLDAVYRDQTLITKVVQVQFRPPLAPGSYPAGVPYDRILATCGVLAVPLAWLQQAAPGAVIVVDVHGKIGGTLARLTVDGNGVAIGRFLPRWASFMSLRHTVGVEPPPRRPHLDDDPVESISEVDPKLLRYDGQFGFVAQWHLPDVTWGPLTENGEFGIQLYAPDGSRAIARSSPHGPGWQITQYGPHRLWDRVEDAYEFWQHTGRPSYEQFGITSLAAADPTSRGPCVAPGWSTRRA